MTDIKGSVALVTGGNRGIGEGFVRTLVAAGASKVYCAARNPDDAKHLVDEFGGAVVALKLDVTDESQIEAAANEATDVNIVINNAGAFLHGLLIGSPENFGYLSGAVKDFLDRTYYPAEGKTLGLPYAMFVSAGNDGSGAVRALERIAGGYQWKRVAEPLICRGEITADALAAARELGQTMAAGLSMGVL